MFRRSALRLSILLTAAGLVFAATGLHAQDKTRWTRKIKSPPPSSRIEITVLKDANGKPVENAAVIFHPVEGDHDKGSLELKTNDDGKAIIDVIPVGDTVRLQVIANGFQTYGRDFKVDKEEISMEVHLKRPGAQYSIYKNNGPTADNSTGSGNKGNDSSKSSDEKSAGNADSKSDSQSQAKPDNHSQNEAQNQ